ncbi:MAG: hypothetical protein ISR95_07105 [Candidatus Marinimicrobia bacterium]|nr:hypothetical protein [Candidatus Neomarinimicrobiota bacterium]
MRWINFLFIILALFIFSCDVTVPPEEFDNPLDEEEQNNNGVDTPALVFFPDEVTINIGFAADVQVFALGLDNLAGAHVIVKYDKTKLELLGVTEGDFFSSAAQTMFISEDDPTTGTLDIYYTYLGGDSTAVNGTGALAILQFATSLGGQSILRYDNSSEFADPDDIPIVIAGFGEGVINAQ